MYRTERNRLREYTAQWMMPLTLALLSACSGMSGSTPTAGNIPSAMEAPVGIGGGQFAQSPSQTGGAPFAEVDPNPDNRVITMDLDSKTEAGPDGQDYSVVSGKIPCIGDQEDRECFSGRALRVVDTRHGQFLDQKLEGLEGGVAGLRFSLAVKDFSQEEWKFYMLPANETGQTNLGMEACELLPRCSPAFWPVVHVANPALADKDQGMPALQEPKSSSITAPVLQEGGRTPTRSTAPMPKPIK